MNIVNLNISTNCYTEEVNGVVVIINEPHVWPNSGTMIPLGSRVSMSLQCISGYATHRVLELDKDKQPCQYDENGVYHQETCLSFCKRYWVVKYCNCNPSFFFPASMISYIYSEMTYNFINVSFMFQPPVFVTAPSRISFV